MEHGWNDTIQLDVARRNRMVSTAGPWKHEPVPRIDRENRAAALSALDMDGCKTQIHALSRRAPRDDNSVSGDHPADFDDPWAKLYPRGAITLAGENEGVCCTGTSSAGHTVALLNVPSKGRVAVGRARSVDKAG